MRTAYFSLIMAFLVPVLSCHRLPEGPASSAGQYVRPLPDSSKLIPLNLLYREKVYRDLDKALEHPDSVFKLGLYQKGLVEVAPVIDTFRYLNSLGLSWNRLRTLPEMISSLRYLQSVHLSNNLFTEFPVVLTRCAEIRQLLITDNQISSLPAEISQMTKLEGLDLKSNHISRLPDEIYTLKKLHTLGLEGNNLKEIDPRIVELTALEKLNLSFNNIRILPDIITRMDLKRLSLKGNPMSSGTIDDLRKKMPGTKIEF